MENLGKATLKIWLESPLGTPKICHRVENIA